MEYLVLSDSHGRADLIDRALALQLRAPDAVLFLGDGIRDLRVLEYQDICVRPVRGNCDFYTLFEGQSAPEHALIEVGAYRILMMHGHTAGVKGGIAHACAKAAEAGGASAICIHGRTTAQMYGGSADRKIIEKVKNCFRIIRLFSKFPLFFSTRCRIITERS